MGCFGNLFQFTEKKKQIVWHKKEYLACLDEAQRQLNIANYHLEKIKELYKT